MCLIGNVPPELVACAARHQMMRNRVLRISEVEPSVANRGVGGLTGSRLARVLARCLILSIIRARDMDR